MDFNGDGHVDVAEFRLHIKSSAETQGLLGIRGSRMNAGWKLNKEIQGFFDKTDQDGDGEMDLDEVRGVVHTHTTQTKRDR